MFIPSKILSIIIKNLKIVSISNYLNCFYLFIGVSEQGLSFSNLLRVSSILFDTLIMLLVIYLNRPDYKLKNENITFLHVRTNRLKDICRLLHLRYPHNL